MKRVAVAVSVLALLVIFAFTAPVMAKAPTTTPIRATQSGTITSIEKEWFSDGIVHRKGVVNQGTIRLYIPDTASSPTYTFSFYNVFDVSVDTEDTNGPYTIRVDAMWKYSEGGAVVGTFEGQINWNMNSPHVAHGLLQGTGIFDGQTLRFWEDTATAGTNWLGTLFER